MEIYEVWSQTTGRSLGSTHLEAFFSREESMNSWPS